MKKITLLFYLLFYSITFAQTTFTVDNINYQIIEGTTNVIATGGDVSGDLEIPNTVNDGTSDFTVTQIGRTAFGSKKLTSLVLPNTLEIIQPFAFRRNPGLVTVTIPASVTEIQSSAFSQSSKITTLILLGTTPPTVSANSFDGEHNIDLTIPDGTLQAYVDAGFIGYKTTNGEVGLGNRFDNNNLFYLITNLEPNTVEAVGGSISTANENKNLTIPATVQQEGTTNTFTVTSIGREAFRNRGITGLNLPNTLTTLNFRAFRDNETLTQVTIPENVISIGSESFFNNGLTKLTMLNPTPVGANNGTFGTRNVIDLIVPVGALTDYENDSRWQGFKSVTEVGTLSSKNILDNNDVSITYNGNLLTINSINNPLKQYAIFNITGQLVVSEQANTNSINIAHLTTGIYLLVLETENGIVREKIIKN
ncbi:leucine-rich repeat protein [Wenyingzhuangia sp. IMCC45533]